MSLIIEYPKLFTEILCDDIIDLFNELNDSKSTIAKISGREAVGDRENSGERSSKEFIQTSGKKCSYDFVNIPKTNNKIEKTLYKNILIKINEYKLSILHKNNDIVNELSKKLKLNNFTIQKYNNTIPENFLRTNSKQNVVTFIVFLNKPKEGGEIIFKNNIVYPEIGKLLIFPDNVDYTFKVNEYIGDYYVISNQISYI